jgi:uncharacterized protein with von Willebrand factor type A (vWA) domain
MTQYVYSAWDGCQLSNVPSADDILNALTDDLLRYGDLSWALEELLRRGYTSPDGEGSFQGFDALLRQLEAAREACLQRYAADAFRLSDRQVQHFQEQAQTAAQSATTQLDPFHDAFPAARMQRHVQEDALQHRYQMIQDRLAKRQGTPPEDRETEMSEHLAHLLAQVQPEAPPLPGQAATPSQRAPALLQYRGQLLRYLHANLNALDRYLDRVELVDQQLGKFPFCGAQPLGLEEAEQLLRELHDLDSLMKRVRWRPGSMAGFNLEQLQRLLRQAGIAPAPQLQQIEALLEQAGLVRNTATGLHLTTRGRHQIGANILHDMFRHSPHARRPHASRRQTADLTGESKPYEFGDHLCLDLGQTLAHATRRGAGLPICLHPEDFEVYRYEPLTQQATVLILDMSHSMERSGQHRFTAAKKVALALAQLIRTYFPRDLLYVVGFGDTARQLRTADLPYATVTREHTNTQAGLQLARRLLGHQRTACKQMVLITDGRPTAARHDGQLYAHTWDLHPVILHETFKEAKRCRQQHITLNTFMLADDVPLIEFVQQLTAVSHGRAFYTTPERLGRYVIEDYISNRKRRAA